MKPVNTTNAKTVVPPIFWICFALLVLPLIWASFFGPLKHWSKLNKQLLLSVLFLIAGGLAWGLSRVLGVSGESAVVERYARAETTSLHTLPDYVVDGSEDEIEDQVIQYPAVDRLMGNLGLLCGIFVLSICAIWPFNSGNSQLANRWIGSLGVIVMGGLTLMVWRLRNHNYVLADAYGIRGSRLFVRRQQFVPWSEIASCEIIHRTNFTGQKSSVTARILDHNGEEKALVSLQDVPEAVRAAFLRRLFFKANLQEVP